MHKRNDNGEAAQAFYDRRRRWRDYLSTRSDVSDRAFRVGYWLAQRMNGDDQCCWYTVPRIATEMGRSVRYVQYGVSELRDANLMLVIPEKGKANAYFLHAPFF